MFEPEPATTADQTPASRPGNCFLVVVATALFVFGNVMIVMRAAVLTTQVYAGDEYGHWANLRFFAAGLAPEQFDPNLPGLNNYLYFFVTEWLARSPEGPAAMRLLNYMFIALSATLVWQLARAFMSRPLALLAAAFVFSFGSTAYAVAVMPETMFTCIVLGLALFMARVWTPRHVLASAVAGLIVGGLMLVKPHGVAIFLSTALTMAVVPVLLHRRLHAVVSAGPDLAALAIGTTVALIFLASLGQGILVLSPTVFVGGYNRQLAPIVSATSLTAIVDVIRYFLAHGVVLLMFFAPAVIVTPLMTSLLLDDSTISEKDAGRLRSLFILAVFTILSALGIFAMASIFTHTVGNASLFEVNRIHGRYWCFLFPLLVTITLALSELSSLGHNARPKVSRWLDRGAGIIWLMAILTFAILVSSIFSIYPWDSPELFAFYRPINPGWNHTAWVPSSFTTCTTLLTVCALTYAMRLPARRLCYVGTLAAVFAIGNINTTGWQVEIMADVRPLVDAGQAATRIVGRQSEGLFVAPEYWGRPQYVLFQLPLRTFVAIKPTSTILTDADIPSTAKWVLTAAAYSIQFRHGMAIPLGAATLYVRSTEP